MENGGGLDLLLRYQPAGGIVADRMAGERWLSRRVPGLSIDRVLVTPGAQGAMLAVASLLAGPGDTVLTEEITYPGFRALAGHLRLRLRGLPMDREGLDPDAFDAACLPDSPKRSDCTPTQHNPTTATMSASSSRGHRRGGTAARRADNRGRCLRTAARRTAAAAGGARARADLLRRRPGQGAVTGAAHRLPRHAGSRARIAAPSVPSARPRPMASPLTAAIATPWIEDGTADAVCWPPSARKRGPARRSPPASCRRTPWRPIRKRIIFGCG